MIKYAVQKRIVLRLRSGSHRIRLLLFFLLFSIFSPIFSPIFSQPLMENAVYSEDSPPFSPYNIWKNTIWKKNLIESDQAEAGREDVYYTENEYIKAGVRSTNGKFVIGTADDRRLMYGFPNVPSTSHTNFKVDDIVYSNKGSLGFYIQPTQFLIDGASLITVWNVGDVTIRQILEPVHLQTHGAILIQYLIENNGESSHSVGVLSLMDLMIDTNDAAPVADGDNYSLEVRDFIGDAVPSYWQAFQYWIDVPNFPGLVGQGMLIGSHAVQPDRFAIGQWGNLQNVTWEYSVPDSESYNDSAVLIWWNPVQLQPQESVTFATLYGSGEVVFNPGELIMSVSAPAALQNIDCSLSPNPFDVNVVINNSGDIIATNLQAMIDLPSGLDLVPGQDAAQQVNPPTLDPGETGTVNWQTLASDMPQDTTLTFSVQVFSTNTDPNQVSRSVFIPSLRPALGLSEDSHNFGVVDYGETALWEMEARNIGSQGLAITSIGVSSEDFSVQVGSYPLLIASCEEIVIPVAFHPLESGLIQGEVTIIDAAGEETVVYLNGNGNTAGIQLSEDSHNFGETPIGSPLYWTLTVINNGTADLRVTELIVAPNPPFSLWEPTDPDLIIPSQSQTDLTIQFLPESDQEFSGQLAFACNDPAFSQIEIPLTGRGVASAISLSQSELHFGQIPVGESAARDLIVYNNGSVTRFITTISSSASHFVSEFSQQLPYAIPPGDSMQMAVRFSPTAPYHYAGYITIENDGQFFTTNVLYVDGDGAATSLLFSDTDLRFSPTPIGGSDEQSFTIDNISDHTVTLNPDFLLDPFGGQFQMVAPIQFPVYLYAGQTLTVTLRFIPQNVGEIQSVMTVYSDDEIVPEQQINLSGTGQGALFSAEIDEYDFGNVQIGETARTEVSISNDGNIPLLIIETEIFPDAFGFQLEQEPIDPGETASLSLSFSPDGTGDFSGTFQIESNDPFNPLFEIILQGTGIDASINFVEDSHDFGDVRVYQSRTDTLLLTNTGTASANITGFEVSLSAFTVAAAGVTIEPNQSVPIQVAFNPNGEGTYLDTLRIFQGNGAQIASLPLTGRGVAPHIRLSYTELDFGAIDVGSFEDRNLTLFNDGDAELRIQDVVMSGNGFEFPSDPDLPHTISPDGQTSYTIRFQPLLAGNYYGSLTIYSDDLDAPSVTVNLNGSGSTGATIQTHSASHDFGLVEMGQEPEWNFQIYNIGTEELNVSEISVDNPTFSFFTESGSRTFIIHPGDSLRVSVRFTPDIPGYENGRITIFSNDYLHDQLNIDLQAAVAGAVAELSSSSLDFGDVRIGTVAERALMILNRGASDLLVSSISCGSDGGGSYFMIDPTTLVPEIVPPLQSKTIRILFTPETEGNIYGGELLINSNDYNEEILSVALSGRCVAPHASLSDAEWDFGHILIRTDAEWNLTLTNVGSDEFVIHGTEMSDTAFVIEADLPDTLLPGANSVYPIYFHPTEVTSYAAELRLMSDDIEPGLILLSGQGAAPQIRLSDLYHDFGYVNDIADWSFTIYNDGNAPLHISSIDHSDSHFSLNPMPQFPISIEIEESRELIVRFQSLQTDPYADDFFIFNS
ncbi:MAG: hypothetical protein B6244_13155, partial [Candidatus Cloacimonetes bacterium 4572_55]